MAMQEILEFWFTTLQPKDWFRQSDDLDTRIKNQFSDVHQEVVAGETSQWRDTPDGRLAEIIVLDQFSRNMFRGMTAAFATDPLSLALAQEAVRQGDDEKLAMARRVFLYMPYMHSESRVVHETALQLFTGTPNLEFEISHKSIIDRFGRYPHRNAVLGRQSTPDEIEWMKDNKGF